METSEYSLITFAQNHNHQLKAEEAQVANQSDDESKPVGSCNDATDS
jgi:hypothetical protein